MVIGLCILEVYLPGCRSLKEKRRVLQGVIDRLRSRFNVAVAELDYQDAWQQSRLGVCTIANSGPFVDEVLAKVIRLVEAEQRLMIQRVSTEKL